jgi:hypothetical protein
MEWSVQTAATYGGKRGYFEVPARLLHFRPFRIIRGYILMQGNITKYTWESLSECGNIEMVAVNEMCTVSLSVCTVSEGQITQPLTVTVGHVETRENESRLLSGELHNHQHDSLSPDEEKERSGLLACFRYFENIKVGLQDHLALCGGVSVYPPY